MSKDSDNVLLVKRLYWLLCFWDKNLLYIQAVLELTILPSQVFHCWNYRQVSPHLALHCFHSFFLSVAIIGISQSMLNTSGKSVCLDNNSYMHSLNNNLYLHSLNNNSFMHSLSTSFSFSWLFLTLKLGELTSRALYHNGKKKHRWFGMKAGKLYFNSLPPDPGWE